MHAPPDIAERFTLQTEVGRGGFGRVYRALDRTTGQPAAVKIVSVSDGPTRERFVREADLLMTVRHPAIVRYLGHGALPGDLTWLAMEWLAGQDLSAHLRGAAVSGQTAGTMTAAVAATLASDGDAPPAPTPREATQTLAPEAHALHTPGTPQTHSGSAGTQAAGHRRLSPQQSVTIAARIAGALGALHAQGAVHRDVKPGNIFLVGSAAEGATLIDFGMARRSAPDHAVTQSGVLVGTPAYMAPEQARGAKDVGPTADVWALGCVLFECLTGASPFHGEHFVEVLARILTHEPPRLRQALPEASALPVALEDLLAAMLARNPADRPRDGNAVRDALDALLSHGELPDLVGGAALLPARRALTVAETRVQCLMIGRRAVGLGRAHEAESEALDRLVAEAGGTAETLLDGSLLVTVPARLGPLDQAVRMARIALRLRTEVPGLHLFMTMGRGASDARFHTAAFGAPSADSPFGPTSEIRLDAVTARLLESRFQVEAGSGPHGRHGPNATVADTAARLQGERPAEGLRLLLGRPSRWVGRTRELTMLRALWEECLDEPVARVALVTANAGMGKSRLRHELLASFEDDLAPQTLLVGQGDQLSAGSAFGLIASIVRGAAGLSDSLPLAERRARLLARVQEGLPGPRARAVAAALGELVSTPFEAADHPGLTAARADPMMMGELIREGWLAFVGAACQAGPTLIVLEDLHWADPATVRFIDAALRAHADRPLLVLALARPEVHATFPRLWADRALQEVRLDALTKRAAAELVREALGARATPEAVEAIVARAGGNAFYLEELIRAFDAGGGATLPDTVLGTVQARLDALGAHARRILRAASIYGEIFWQGGVASLLGAAPAQRTQSGAGAGPESGAEGDLPRWLDELVEREIVVRHEPSRIAHEAQYKFGHALVREAVYQMLTPDDAALGHRLAGEWLVGVGERDAVAIAGHFLQGGAGWLAVPHLAEAAEASLEANDLAAAAGHVARALAAAVPPAQAGQADQTGQADQPEHTDAPRLYALKATIDYWRGDYAAARVACDAALARLPEGGAAWFQTLGTRAVSCARLGDPEGLDACRARALATPRAPGAEALNACVVCLCRVAFQLVFAARFSVADALIATIDAVVAEASDTHSPTPGAANVLDPLTRAQRSHLRGVRAAHVADVGTFLAELEVAVAAFVEAGDLRNALLERTTIGWCHTEVGDFEVAASLIEQNLADCQRNGAQQAITYAKVNLGQALSFIEGREAEAERLLDEAVAECRAVNNPRLAGWALAHRSTLDWRLGRKAASRAAAEAAVDALRAAPGLRAWALACLSRALLDAGEVDLALENMETARETEARLGGLLQGEALATLMRARALHAAGRLPEARSTIAHGAARLRERAKTLPPGPAPFSELFFTRVAEHVETLRLEVEWQT